MVAAAAAAAVVIVVPLIYDFNVCFVFVFLSFFQIIGITHTPAQARTHARNYLRMYEWGVRIE